MRVNIEVKRHRSSVTQGIAMVFINGTCAITFDDKIELIKKGEKYYGEIIGGWASVKPDMAFITGLFFHPVNDKIPEYAKSKFSILKDNEVNSAKTVLEV